MYKNLFHLTEAPEEVYVLDVKTAVQTIRAAGFTDDDNISAVADAWKVFVNDDKTINKR